MLKYVAMFNGKCSPQLINRNREDISRALALLTGHCGIGVPCSRIGISYIWTYLPGYKFFKENIERRAIRYMRQDCSWYSPVLKRNWSILLNWLYWHHLNRSIRMIFPKHKPYKMVYFIDCIDKCRIVFDRLKVQPAIIYHWNKFFGETKTESLVSVFKPDIPRIWYCRVNGCNTWTNIDYNHSLKYFTWWSYNLYCRLCQ